MISKKNMFSITIRIEVICNLVNSFTGYCSSVIIDFHQLSSAHNILSMTKLKIKTLSTNPTTIDKKVIVES